VKHDADVVIIGAGIAGSALATVLSRQGIAVLLLEKSLEHQDRVRGEFIVPWGVDEAAKLGILDVLMQVGGHYTTRSVPYGEGVRPDQARARAVDMAAIVPGVMGALNLGHPRACDALNRAALRGGATLLRGVEHIHVSAGVRPGVAFDHDGVRHTVFARLVVGADGRGSTVAKQLGIKREFDPVHHLITGLLVDGVDDWPQEEQSIGTCGDISFYIFPQGQGRVRLYVAYGLDQKDRFAGADAAGNLLEAVNCEAVAHCRSLARARLIGPCHGYPNNDVWTDIPISQGVILIGDAAGHNDPSGGQGISIAFKDARLVSEAIRSHRNWTPEAFAPYANERRERMRRLRFSGRLLAKLRMEFNEEGKSRGRRGLQRILAHPELALPLVAFHKGPFAVPESAFDQPTWDRLLI
jgi:2-polyprenyl-6-methoxyphenol hydroxylase-like FAD-dependent oxidoreductase